MKKRWIYIRTVVALCAALGWWGYLYPEFTLTPDTCVVIEEDGTIWDAEMMWEKQGDLYRNILEADGNQIRFKSRLLEMRKKWIEKLQ